MLPLINKNTKKLFILLIGCGCLFAHDLYAGPSNTTNLNKDNHQSTITLPNNSASSTQQSAISPPAEKKYIKYNKAVVRVLNKITGKAKEITAPIGVIIPVDQYLSLLVRACYKASQAYDPEDVMFIQVAAAAVATKDTPQNNQLILKNANQYVQQLISHQANIAADNNNAIPQNSTESTKSGLIFSGWMFSTTPEISALNNPSYDIAIVRCIN